MTLEESEGGFEYYLMAKNFNKMWFGKILAK